MASKTKKDKEYPNSLALSKFRARNVMEIRSYWYFVVGSIYAERWWRQIPTEQWPRNIAEWPGDDINPFRQIRVPPEEYIGQGGRALATLRQNVIVLFVAIFETYLYDAVKRALFIKPDIVDDSKIKIEAKELALVGDANLKDWFSRRIADHYMRGKTHDEMIEKISVIAKWSTPKALRSEWHQWVLLRNAIVHLNGTVSPELAEAWSVRFPAAGKEVVLTDDDVARVSVVAARIAESLDRRLIEEVIGDQDEELLIRELFVRFGPDDVLRHSGRIGRMLGVVPTKERIRSVISKHRNDNNHDVLGFSFTSEMLRLWQS